MKNLQKFLSAAFLMLVSVAAFAQSYTVKGKVADQAGEPVIGAHVFVKGTNAGVVTDVAGEFTITAKANDVLVASVLGYQDAEVVVTGSKADFVLKEDSEFLEEVVVLGYGVNARRKDLSASVGVISNAEKLVERPVATVNDMLQGQLAGVVVSSNGGDPTSTPGIVIRGQGSRNGDSVLWVVDGVPNGPIPSPNEIEAIVVLKDAASAAIYGAQSGAGGVILVTTKSASKGDVSISYEGIIGARTATNIIQPLNAEEEIQMRKISYANSDMTLPDGWDVTKNPYVGVTRTNWMDEIFQTAVYKRHNVTLNGGNDKIQSRLTLSFMDNPGTLRYTYRKNLAVRYNVNFKINDYITLSEDFSWINNERRGVDTNSGHSGIIASALFMPPSATVYNPLDGTYGGTVNEDPAYAAAHGGTNFADIHGDAINPVRMLEAGNRYHKMNEIWTTTKLTVANLVKGLKFNSRFTYKVYNSFQKNFTPKRDEIGKPELVNKLYLHSARNDNWNWENTLSYDQTFGKHTIGALASVTADSFVGKWMSIDGSDFADESDFLQYIKYAQNTTPQDGLDGPDANLSFVGRLSYAYDQRYFLTASFRRDYAGRLPDGHNFGDFPAVTAAWKISNEEFFPKNDVVNMLKLRASWGRVGNLGSIGMNYKSSTLSTWTRSYISSIGTELGNQYGLGVYNTRAINNQLTWETSEQVNVGLDFDMFSDKLQFSVDFFNKRTYNLIQDQPMNWPQTIGLDAMKVNLGEIRNRGIELQATWNEKINKDFSYFVSGNFSYLKNWISDIGVKTDDGEPGTWVGGGDFLSIPWVYQTTQGQPIDCFYLIKTDGIFQSDAEAAAYVKDGERIQPNAKAGDMKFVDFNDDGKIDDKDRQYMGGATPKTTFAFSFGATWKNLSVSAMLQGVGGAQAVNVAKYITHSDAGGNFNRSKATLDTWSPTNTSSTTPRLMRNDPNQNFTRASDWYLEDASYVRLKNLTVSYDFTSLLSKVKHFSDRNSRASIYFSGENLFTITKYSGMDPECGGWDAMKYPVSRVLSLGIKLTY